MRAALRVALLVLVAPPALAAPDDLVSTRALGAGEALTAYATGAAGLHLNPAGIAVLRQYVVEAAYQYGPDRSAHQAEAAITDSVTSAVAAGLFYDFDAQTPDAGHRRLHSAGLALSYLIANAVAFGAETRWLNLSVDGAHGNDLDNVFTYDAGLIVRPFGGLSFGAAGRNLKTHGAELRRTLGLGAAWALGDRALLAFDTVLDSDRPHGASGSTVTGKRYDVGGELFLAGSLALRAGGIFDTTAEASYVTGGLGWVTPAGSLEASLRQQVSGTGSDTLMSFGLRLFVQ